MKHLTDKLLLLLACVLLLGTPAGTPELVVAVLAGVASAALFELVPAPGRVASPAAVCILSLVRPAAFLPALPLAAYDLTRAALGTPGRMSWAWLGLPVASLAVAMASHMAAQAPDPLAFPLAVGAVAPAGVVCALACLLAARTAQSLAERRELKRLRDSLQESVLHLRRKNAELDEARAHQARAATLAERARIARAIHDNVGHLLTRSLFQVEALQVVHASDALGTELAPVGATLQEALDTVRASVHDLHDESLDLEVQLASLAASYAGGTAELSYEAHSQPALAVADCFAAVARESLANAARHGRADRVRLCVEEHPGFWRLRVTDNGVARPQACDPPPADGLGLRSMRERVEALGGTFWAAPTPSSTGGFTVFASIPKHPRSAP